MGADEVSSHDTSACFSDEEWKLLQDWQKKLYKNVMKEIHQALISLGPLIATTVSSLRAKEKEELYPLDKQDSESRQGGNRLPGDRMANTDVSFRIKREVPQRLNNLQDSEGSARNDCVLAGFPALNNDVSLRKEEPVSVSIDHRGTEPIARSNNPNSGYEVVSFQIKDEEEVYFIEDKDTRRIPATEAPSGDESMKRKKKVGDFTKGYERTTVGVCSGKINTMAPQSSLEVNYGRQMWADWDQERAAQCESSFSNSIRSYEERRSPELGASDPCIEYDSSLRPYLPSAPQHRTPCTPSEDERTCSPTGQATRPMRTHLRVRPYACSECQKSFFHKSHLTTHQRIHSGEKPYLCVFCHKRFHRKDNLDKHIRIHTGERPYTCTRCEKTFIQRSHLTEHQRKHT